MPPPSLTVTTMSEQKKEPKKKRGQEAKLFSPIEPSPEQRQKVQELLQNKYGGRITISWQEDKNIYSGFRIIVGDDTYDWTEEARLKQLEQHWHELTSGKNNGLMPLVQDIRSWKPTVHPEELGTVLRTGDGIASIRGLDHAAYGEILLFESGVRGMVQGLRPNRVDCILFGGEREVTQGSAVRCTGRTAGIPVGNAFLGRVIDPLGEPIDGLGPLQTDGYRPAQMPAPGILDRQSVNRPLETGILAIDAMFPIGRGQRELIIGDRQTGKTSIALDTILNQKGKNVICIYVAIGQKSSSVARLVETLRERDALEYSIVVAATAGTSAPLQYLAPYSGCAIGEHFMYQGKDVLIVYDDLSKHATAYRTLSLLLERSPGREAYPGDIFYVHSQLLERAAQLSQEKGGGSMTALPIVETQAGDVSAYIPTNVISITDGQLFLESELFFAGQRPAVNVGISVSRVGSSAQAPAVKKAVGSLRLDLAQYREMAVFTQFSGDLDDATRRQLTYGNNLMRLLRQSLHQPLARHAQVILLLCAMRHYFDELDPDQVPREARKLVQRAETLRPDLCREIDEMGTLPEELSEVLSSLMADREAQHG